MDHQYIICEIVKHVLVPCPQISKKDADHFVPGQWIPECQLIVEWEGEEQRPVRLRHKVDLIGAKAPFNFIHLILNPESEGNRCRASIQCTNSKALYSM